MSRLAAFLLLTAAAVMAAGLVFWRVGGGETAHDGAPAWSPDNRRIVFSVEENGQTDLYVMDADGTNRRALTSTPAQEGAPAFSPDGSKIAFESDRDGNPEIYVMDANGQNAHCISNHPGADRAPAWSPDGRRVVFLSDRDRAPQSDVYTMSTDGADVRRLTTTGQHWAPQISPSGQSVAVQSGQDIEVIDLRDWLAAGSPRQLTTAPKNGMSPSWSPDGSRVAFATTRNARLELFTMAADGSDQQMLVTMPSGSVLDPKWSPDGTRVAFVYVPKVDDKSSRSQPYAIYVLEVATQKVTRLSP